MMAQYSPQMVESWQTLMRIDTRMHTTDGASTDGDGRRAALAFILRWAQEHGLSSYDGGDYAFVEFGQGSSRIDVITHIDVADAQGEWTYPPFDGLIVEAQMLGRGAQDGKGPTMSALWALYLLKSLAPTEPRVVRVVVLTDSERAGASATHYLQQWGAPAAGFRPEGVFARRTIGQGAAIVRLVHRAETQAMTPSVVQFEGGADALVPPDHAYVVIECHSETAAAEWETKLLKEARQRQLATDLSIHGSRLQLAVHASPARSTEERQNPLAAMIQLLAAHCLGNASMWRFISQLAEPGASRTAANDHPGQLSPLAGYSVLGGGLGDDSYAFLFDIRYASDEALADVLAEMQGLLSDKWSLELLGNHRPLTDAAWVSALCALLPADPEPAADTASFIHWASFVPNTVVFGPLQADDPMLAHALNESWSTSSYLHCTQLYAQAMQQLLDFQMDAQRPQDEVFRGLQ